MTADVRPPAPHGASPDGPVGGGDVFEFLPKDFDLQQTAMDTVGKYPLACLAAAAVVGFWLGRTRGRAILGAAVGIGAKMAMRHLGSLLAPEEG